MIKNNNLKPYYTFLSLPLKITIALRWNPGKDVVKKAAECAGKACNDFLKSSAANTAVNAPDDSATPPPVNPHPMPKGPTSDPATLLVKPPGKDLLDTMPPPIKTGHVTSLKENVLGKEVSSSCTKMDLTNPAFDNLKKMVINYPTPNQSDKSQEPSTSTSVSVPHGVVQTSQRYVDMKLAQPNIKLVQASFPSDSNKAEVELEANRTLPTGIDFSNNVTDQTFTIQIKNPSTHNSTPEQFSQTSSIPNKENNSTTEPSTYESNATMQGHSGTHSLYVTNTGPLGTSSPAIKNSLNVENTQTIPHTQPVPNTHIRRYATITQNAYDLNTQDPLAAQNNPPIPLANGQTFHHPEVRLNICNFPGCNNIICVGLCGNPIGSKAVGHLTHGYPNIPASQGKVVNLDANEDAKKLPEPQNAVMYVKAHRAGLTTENTQGTAFLNQPHVQTVIEQNADKS